MASASAQTGQAAQSSPAQDTVVHSVWRATSRLGYGPAPVAVGAQNTPNPANANSASSWATQQLEAAYAASQRPANVPADINRFNDPLPQLIADYRMERDNRRINKEAPAGAAKPGSNVQAQGALSAQNQLTPLPALDRVSRESIQTASAWRLMACSRADIEVPMLARMTEFWFNHLNVFSGKGTVRPFVGHYVVNVIRPNALGKFEDLLLTSAKHPAMLLYLDQAQSVAPQNNNKNNNNTKNQRGLNENYARELMELHTLGVGSGYTQNDVRELARILTGWTVNLQNDEGFRFADRLHDQGSKTLLGKEFAPRGMAEGEAAIRMLARHPATAQRIALRLAQFFVADQPPAALVERLAKSFLASQGDMRTVMRSLIGSPEFWQPENTLFKTPLDYACSVLTASGGARDKRDINQALGFLARAGQPMHGWQTPDGYKTDAATWLAPEAITRRADYAMAMAPRIAEPTYLLPYLSSASRERLAREALPLRTGLILASPELMRK